MTPDIDIVPPAGNLILRANGKIDLINPDDGPMTREHAEEILGGPIEATWVNDDAQHVLFARPHGDNNKKPNVGAFLCYQATVYGDAVVTTAVELATRLAPK